MNAEIFAEWLLRQGFKTYKTESSYWFNQGFKVFQAFPYHWIITPDDRELSDFLKRTKGIGLRYSTPIFAQFGVISYHAVYTNDQYQIENLGKWARKNVRKGLRNCTVTPISFDLLASDGYDLQIETLERQKRKLSISKKEWEIRCKSAGELPGFQAWGAYVGRVLAASVITFQMDDWVYMLYQQCRRNYLDHHVNNALSFVVTNHIIEIQKHKNILYGLHSLDAPPSIDEFKFRMGYSAKPVRQRVSFSSKFQFIFNNSSHKLINSFTKIFPGSPFLAKAEGMIRFYLQGKLPLDRQTWPNGVLEQKDTIISHLTYEKIFCNHGCQLFYGQP